MFDGVSFASPWILAALIILPALWYLLRLTPPPPKNRLFGPFVLLHDLSDAVRKPKAPPWWFWLIRLGLAALIIIALSDISQKSPDQLSVAEDRRLVVLVEDSGAAAAHWPAIKDRLMGLVEQSRKIDRSLFLIKGSEADSPPRALSPAQMASAVGAWEPVGYPLSKDYAKAVTEACAETCNLIIFSDGLHFESEANDWVKTLADVPNIAKVDVVLPLQDAPIIQDVQPTPEGLKLTVYRGLSNFVLTLDVNILTEANQILQQSTISLNIGQQSEDIALELADALRDKAAIIKLDDFVLHDPSRPQYALRGFGESAASTYILPLNANFWRVALLSNRTGDDGQRLTSAEHYLRQALTPWAVVEDLSPVLNIPMIDRFANQGVSTLFMFKAPNFAPDVRARLETYVEEGGQIVWIASPALGQVPDELLPVRLRQKALQRGGTFEWAKETFFGQSHPDSPLADLYFAKDSRVKGQILPEPGQDTEERTWLSAQDGTPLITGITKGKGHVIYLHAGLSPEWSDLVLKKGFLPLVKRLLNLSKLSDNRASDQVSERLIPMKILDGFGVMKAPHASVEALRADAPRISSAVTPPGLYGEGFQREALSYGEGHGLPVAYTPALSADVVLRPLHEAPARNIKAIIFLVAFAILLCDGFILAVRTMLNWRQSKLDLTAPALIFSIMIIGSAGLGLAQTNDERLANSKGATNLGFVQTGEASVDRRTKLGIETLLKAAAARTTFKAGKAMAVDFSSLPADLDTLPLVYWPLRGKEASVSDTTLTNIALYLKQGGMIVFDTRDYLASTQTLTTPAKQWLVDLHGHLALPDLRRAPDYHVIARSFYLLSDMVGRLGKGRYWVSEDDVSNATTDALLPRSDGLSPIIIVESDMAGLWAQAAKQLERTRGLHLAHVKTDWEMAIRGGVNLILYALTGNYKADQVHVPKILSIIGQ